jgi:DNA polymerase-3 subunit beta
VKFRCERDVLVEALGTSGRAAATKGSGPVVLSGVQLQVEADTLHLAGNDRDLTIQTEVTVAGAGDGVCVIPARLGVDIVRALEAGAVTVEASEDEMIRISSGRSHFALRSLPADEFPRLPAPPNDAVVLEAPILAAALRQVVRAASADDSRPVLTGVLMTADEVGLKLVATDSYRLAVRELPGSTVLQVGQKVLVPSRALSELQRLLSSAGTAGEGSPEVKLRLGEFQATFEIGATSLTTRLLQGDYPNYAGLIPASYPNRLIVGREALLDAVRRVKLMVRDANTPVRLALRAEGIELTVITPDLGQASEEIDAKYEGTEMTIAFNPAYLIDGAEAIEGDEVALETLDGTKPATMRATEASNYLYLLMPVRVS